MVSFPHVDFPNTIEKATKSLKSMIVDRLIILDMYPGYSASLDKEANTIVGSPKGNPPSIPLNGVFPKKWLAELRVRDLEIQRANLNGYFLTDDALEGQSDFLTSLVVKNANLEGHLCGSCSPDFSHVSTKALRFVPLLTSIDLSHNHLEVVDGSAFPVNVRNLEMIVLSNNRINKIHDRAFAALGKLQYLDVSRNQLTTINKKMFNNNQDLSYLDFSHNSIHVLDGYLFQNINALRTVKLVNNLIETLSNVTFAQASSLLSDIDLKGNFFVCNCSMKWIARKLTRTVNLSAFCVAPVQYVGQDLKSVMAQESCG